MTPQNASFRSKARPGFGLLKAVIGGGVVAAGFIGFMGAEYPHSRVQKNVSTCDRSLGSLMIALESYRNLGGNYPSQSQGLEALLINPTTDPMPQDWFQIIESDQALYDPWGTKLAYYYPGKQGPLLPEIISAGPDKAFGTEDDQSSQDGM